VQIVKRLLEAGADPGWSFNGRSMAQAAAESPARWRGDLQDLLQHPVRGAGVQAGGGR
jgi:hypothetical protein